MTDSKSKEDEKLYNLPVARIRIIMKSSGDPNVTHIKEESLFVVTRAAEMFIQYLAKGCLKYCKNILDYRSLAKFVDQDEKLEILNQIIPKKFTVKRIKELLAAELQKDSDTEDDDEEEEEEEEEEEDEEKDDNSKKSSENDENSASSVDDSNESDSTDSEGEESDGKNDDDEDDDDDDDEDDVVGKGENNVDENVKQKEVDSNNANTKIEQKNKEENKSKKVVNKKTSKK